MQKSLSKIKKFEIAYTPLSTREAEKRLDQAFDVLFEAVFKTYQVNAET